MTDTTTEALRSSLAVAIKDTERCQMRAERLGTQLLEALMVDRGWAEIQVDIEDRRFIEQVTFADGSTSDVPDEDYDLAGEASMGCSRSLYTYRDREYRATVAEVRATIAALEEEIKEAG